MAAARDDRHVLPVPRHWSDVTPAWLSTALHRTVTHSTVTEVAAGTNARAVVELVYAEHGSGPPRVSIKREGRVVNRLALTALGACEAEADLVVNGTELPLEHPVTYAAATDRRRLAAVVVMEDITLRGGRPNSALRALSVAQVAAGLTQLARMHAAYWEAAPTSVRPWRLGRVWTAPAWAGFVRGLRQLRRNGIDLRADAAELERGFRGWARIAVAGPQTLLHGDPHPGNTYTLDTGVGFYDWQLIRSGSWAHDVGYFVTASLTVADRRAYERELLAGYLAALGRHPADAWQLYRRTPVFGLGSWLQTLAAGTFQPRAVCLATLERFVAAYQDAREDCGRE